MKRMAAICLSLTIASVSIFTVEVPGKEGSYDGRWWLSVDQRERNGFVVGFVVCYGNLVDHALFKESMRAYIIRLNEYFQGQPESQKEPIETALIKIAGPPYAKSVHRPPTPTETPKESAAKWGANNDGDEWRGPDAWNLGYIQGFLECYSKQTKHEYGTFSKTPDWYVKAIADWYGTKDDDPQAINPTREPDKIPEVLFRFRDGQDK